MNGRVLPWFAPPDGWPEPDGRPTEGVTADDSGDAVVGPVGKGVGPGGLGVPTGVTGAGGFEPE